MKILIVENPGKIKKAIKLIESKLNVKISYKGSRFEIKGDEYKEFLCDEVIRAIDFGFDAEDALLLANEDYSLQFLNIKEHTKKKNLAEVRSRVIGANGRAKATIQELTGAVIIIHDNNIGIIVSSEHLDSVVQALISLIGGSKHANVFAYLEKQNKFIKKIDEEDLGLKVKVKKEHTNYNLNELEDAS
jgi:ribosomal RNA assembly protein